MRRGDCIGCVNRQLYTNHIDCLVNGKNIDSFEKCPVKEFREYELRKFEKEEQE